MIDILQYLPPRTKKSPSGWYSFSGPCCLHNGETPDKRKRGGLKVDSDGWSYNCFNCKFKVKFVYGQTLSFKARKLLSWLGVDDEVIEQINLDSIKNKKIYDLVDERSTERNEIIQRNIHFKPHTLPFKSRPITKSDKWAVDYLRSRRIDYTAYPFKITPHVNGRDQRRIIIPFLYGDDVVGYTSRYLDNNNPRYISEGRQPGYIFGLNLQKSEWEHIIVAEGIFDALSIGGVSLLGSEISNVQEALLRRQGKEVIVVPDQDKSGLHLVEKALEAGFSVSIPNWPEHVKDINDAVIEYGRLGALISIMSNKTSNRIVAYMATSKLITKKNL